MSPLLILAAGFFQDPPFAAREAVSPLGLDLFEDFIDGRVGVFCRFGVMDFELWLRIQSLEHPTAGKDAFDSPPGLKIQESEQRAAQMASEGDFRAVAALSADCAEHVAADIHNSKYPGRNRKDTVNIKDLMRKVQAE